ncbi:MAG: hypothetical protein A2075_22495 [Geobacteraceae bacterium GWC2_58_44]|nr:MAG: hypothetical protein A2075_22495 [Geobacteraceae bacterium GWC2_58_44]HBG04034.1 hypothetical protein [Geobacter sp.]
MKRSLHLASTIISPLIFLLLTAVGVAAAEQELWEAAQEPDPPVSAADIAVRSEDERQVEALEQKGGSLGYSFVIRDGHGGRAHEYGLLRSSRSGGLFYRNLEKDSNLELEGYFLNQDDYHGDLLVVYGGDYRLHLRTESLFHNLDRELLFTPAFQLFRADQPAPPPPPLPAPAPLLADYLSSQQDGSGDYGVSVTRDRADFRYRLHNYPLHLNLGYWRLVKEGTVQQRFADASFEGTPNTVYAVPRAIDRRTHEGRLGLDAHLGPVDLSYDFRIRVFDDRKPIPVANFVARNDLDGNPVRVEGLQQHSEDPDSRFISHAVKLHTSLSGGLVGSGSYSMEERENLSRLSDTTGVKHARVKLQNAAGDLVYTPSKEYSLALKYRRQELDHRNRGPVASNNFLVPLQPVKPPIDSTKDLIITTLSYRPRHDLSLTGEYRGEFLKRNNVSELPALTTWALPDNSDTHTGSLSLYYRPVKGLRSSANYSYATTNHPSYGASFQERHEGKLLVTYTRNSWGATASAVIRREWNDEVEHFLIDFPLEPLVFVRYPLLSRERRTENSSLGVWFAPLAKLTLAGNYAYLQSRADQAVLFTVFAPGSEAAARFSSRSHVFGLNATYQAHEKLDLSLMLQHVFADSAFEPRDTVFSATSDTQGIREITRQRSLISAMSARGEYRFTGEVSGLMDYSVRNYNEKNPAYSEGNGTVHTIVASVAAKW